MTKEDFKLLFDKYFDPVRSYLLYRGADKELATDLAQDVFLRIWEKQMEYDHKHIKQLLYKIAGDMFVSRYRREVLEQNYRNSFRYTYTEPTPEDELNYRDLETGYTKALAELGEKQRTVFLMARIDGLKYHEIADRLQLSVKAVEKRMHIALTHLKKALNQ